MNTINAATSVTVTSAAITALAASNLADLTTLHTQRAGFSDLTNITAVTLTDNGGGVGSVDFGTLETIVDNYQANIKAGIAFSFQAGDLIDIDTSDELSAYLTDIGGALVLSDQDVTVDSSVGVSVANAKSIAADTTGTVTATITSGTRVSDLTELRDPDGEGLGGNEENAWTITLHSDDATAATAAELNTINAATSVTVTSAAITALAASNLADLTTLHTQRAGFSDLTNITAVTLTDNGGGVGSVDFGTLETIVDNYQANIKAGIAFSFQAGDLIDIDTSDELTAYLADITSGALALTDQDVTVDSLSLIHISEPTRPY